MSKEKGTWFMTTETFSNRIKSGKLEYHGFLWIPHKY